MKAQNIDEYISHLDAPAKDYAVQLRRLIHESRPDVCEKIFASQPAYYIEDSKTTNNSIPMVTMFFFKDHVNIFAEGNKLWKEKIKDYTWTKKNALQIYYDQTIDENLIKKVFMDSF